MDARLRDRGGGADRPPGGTGKTALVKRWLDGVKARGWGGAVQVCGWSSARASTPPRAATPDAPTYPRAAAIWRKKLEFLLEQEALSSNPAQRFELAAQIAECRAKLRELGVEP